MHSDLILARLVFWQRTLQGDGQMTKFTVANRLFKTTASRAETSLEKTTRAAKEILAEEAAKRQVKIEQLRKARLTKEAAAPEAATKAKSSRKSK